MVEPATPAAASAPQSLKSKGLGSASLIEVRGKGKHPFE